VTYRAEAPLRDLGVGGVAILVEDDIYRKMSKGKVIKQVNVEINGRSIQMPSTVRWKSKVAKSLSLMGLQNAVGLEFLYLEDDDQEYINRYVLEELYNKINV